MYLINRDEFSIGNIPLIAVVANLFTIQTVRSTPDQLDDVIEKNKGLTPLTTQSQPSRYLLPVPVEAAFL